ATTPSRTAAACSASTAWCRSTSPACHSRARAHAQAQTVAYANEGGLRVSRGVISMRVLILEIGPREVAAFRGVNLLCGGSVTCLHHPFAPLCPMLVESALPVRQRRSRVNGHIPRPAFRLGSEPLPAQAAQRFRVAPWSAATSGSVSHGFTVPPMQIRP